MTRTDIIKKLAEIDAELCRNRYDHHLTAENAQRLRLKRERLEKRLYK